MTVEQIADLINKVCGLSSNWAKVCVYYCTATHHLGIIDWMPILLLVGVPGSGKTELRKVLEQLAYKPTNPPINCEGISYATLRDELAKNKGTAILEEADQHPNRKQLEGLLLARVDKKGTAVLRGKKQLPDGTYRHGKRNLFGATIVHDRHGFNSLATARRTIAVELERDTSITYIKAPTGLSLPSSPFGNIPDIFNAVETSGSALDTWSPLIRIAKGLSDDDWLCWAWGKVAEDNDTLADGQKYELEQAILGAVISAYCDTAGMLLVKDSMPLPTVTAIVRKEYPWIEPKTIGTRLRKMGKVAGLKTDRIGGVVKIFTSVDQLRKIAERIGYHDTNL